MDGLLAPGASVFLCVGGPEPHLPTQLLALVRQTVDPRSWELEISYNFPIRREPGRWMTAAVRLA